MKQLSLSEKIKEFLQINQYHAQLAFMREKNFYIFTFKYSMMPCCCAFEVIEDVEDTIILPVMSALDSDEECGKWKQEQKLDTCYKIMANILEGVWNRFTLAGLIVINTDKQELFGSPYFQSLMEADKRFTALSDYMNRKCGPYCGDDDCDDNDFNACKECDSRYPKVKIWNFTSKFDY